jgi:hypothetical protein
MNKLAGSGLRELISKKKYKQALELAEANNSFGQLIQLMSDNTHYKTAIGFIRDKGYSLANYPALEERAMKKCVRYLISACDNWEQTEIQLLGNKQLLTYFAEDLFFKSTQQHHHSKVFKGTRKNKGKPKSNSQANIFLFHDEEAEENIIENRNEAPADSKSSLNFADIALSIVHRHDLMSFLKKQEIIKGLSNPHTMVHNSILLNDAFSKVTSLLRTHQYFDTQLPDSPTLGDQFDRREAGDETG